MSLVPSWFYQCLQCLAVVLTENKRQGCKTGRLRLSLALLRIAMLSGMEPDLSYEVVQVFGQCGLPEVSRGCMMPSRVVLQSISHLM